jgi:hypothetical protein
VDLVWIGSPALRRSASSPLEGLLGGDDEQIDDSVSVSGQQSASRLNLTPVADRFGLCDWWGGDIDTVLCPFPFVPCC